MTVVGTHISLDDNTSAFVRVGGGDQAPFPAYSSPVRCATSACHASTLRPQPISEEQQCDYIPYDYDEEMEVCSQYVFSDTLFTSTAHPIRHTAFDATEHQDDDEPAAVALCQEDCIPFDYDSEMCAYDAAEDVTTDDDHSSLHPFSAAWLTHQRDLNCASHEDAHYRWTMRMTEQATPSVEVSKYGLKALLREACQRDLRRLRAIPAVCFTAEQPLAGASMTASVSFTPALMNLTSDTSPEERKTVALVELTRQWRELARAVEREVESDPLRARSIMSLISGMSLFSSDHAGITRELSVSAAEERQRQRRERAQHLLATLEAQGTLFVLPTLYAEECVDPTPVSEELSVCSLTQELEDTIMMWSVPSFPLSLSTQSSGSTSGTTLDDIDSIGHFSGSLSLYTSPMSGSRSDCCKRLSFNTLEGPFIIGDFENDAEATIRCITFFDPVFVE